MKTIKITQIKSGIDRPERQKLTLRALGLNKMNASREVEATAQILGMVRAVNHLLKIEEVEDGNTSEAAPVLEVKEPVSKKQRNEAKASQPVAEPAIAVPATAEKAAPEVVAEKPAVVEKAQKPASEVVAESPAAVKIEEPVAEAKVEEPVPAVQAKEPVPTTEAEEPVGDTETEEPGTEAK